MKHRVPLCERRTCVFLYLVWWCRVSFKVKIITFFIDWVIHDGMFGENIILIVDTVVVWRTDDFLQNG